MDSKDKSTTTPIAKSWDEIKTNLKSKFHNLVDTDLMYVEGKKDEMMGNLQAKLGKSKAELAKIISEL